MAKSAIFIFILSFLEICAVNAFVTITPECLRPSSSHRSRAVPARYSLLKTARYASEYDYDYDYATTYTDTDKDEGPLDVVPVIRPPLDIFDTCWKLDITIVPFDYTKSDEQYSLQFPVHLKLDGTVGVFETDVVCRGFRWNWRSYAGEQFVDFNIELKGLEVIPDGLYNFNLQVLGDDEEGFRLETGFLRTPQGTIQNRDDVPQPHIEMRNAGSFTALPIAEMPYELYGIERE